MLSSRTKCTYLAKYLWLFFSVALLIYSLAAPSNRQLYNRLALTALATVMLSLRLQPVSAVITTFISSSIGLICLRFFPLLPKVSPKKLPVFIETFNAYQTTLWQYSIFLLALAVLLAFSVSKITHHQNSGLENRPPEQTPKLLSTKQLQFSTFDLTSIAIFVAFGVVINTVRAGYFSFGGFPIILAGLSLGPVNGFIVGLLTDLVAFVVRPGGAFSPIYVLTSALTGFLPIYILKLISSSKEQSAELDFKNCKYWQLLLAVAIGQFLTSVLIVSLSRSLLYAEGAFMYFFITSLSRQVFNVPLYTYLCLGILQSVNLSHLRFHRYKHLYRKPKL